MNGSGNIVLNGPISYSGNLGLTIGGANVALNAANTYNSGTLALGNSTGAGRAGAVMPLRRKTRPSDKRNRPQALPYAESDTAPALERDTENRVQ